MIRIDRNQETNFLARGICARSSPFQVSRKGGRVPSEKNNVIRTRYMHVLNSDGSVSMSLFTYRREYKSSIIPEQSGFAKNKNLFTNLR